MKDDTILKTTFKFDNKTHIFYKYYCGEISIQEINDSWIKMIAANVIPQSRKGFILDYRKASFNIELDEYIKIADFYQKNIKTFKDCKIAIITNNPMDIVIPILVREKDKGYASKPFSTVEAAAEWILETKY